MSSLQMSLRSKPLVLFRPVLTGPAIQRRSFGSFRPEETAYWQRLKPWRDVTHEQFLSYEWQVNKTPKTTERLLDFLEQIVPAEVLDNRPGRRESTVTRQAFLIDIREGIKAAPMAVRLTPHLLAIANWKSPFDDPIIRQFVPLKSNLVPDHPMATLDSLDEKKYSPVPGLVHRYPDRVLMLATGTCPSYCRFCTRSYAIGASTDTVQKISTKPGRTRWINMLNYVEERLVIRDAVVSGGDSYTLHPEHLTFIGNRLLEIDHMKCFRIAARGPSFCPMRIIDSSDLWSDSLIDLSDRGRQSDTEVVLHTHFNHPAEINWVTASAMRYLFRRGVTVRNQTVLLRGVNDNVETMSTLIRSLADLHVKPYYVYQMDMVKGVEDLRTPLSTILELESQITGTITGFDLPKFVVDLPGGGGKRPASTYDTYDKQTGVSTFRAPGIAGDRVFTYYDPLPRDE